MTFDLGQFAIAAGAGIVIFAVTQIAASQLAVHGMKIQQSEHHEQNRTAMGVLAAQIARIEKAIGLDDPDEAAFVRQSEARRAIEDNELEHNRLHGRLKDHEGRITGLERKSR
jgi:hypothetical protein